MSIERKLIRLTPFDMEDASYSASSHPLYPIRQTNGLVFIIPPNVSETTTVNYSSAGSFVNTNEDINVYQNTSNRTITLSNIKFPCDTKENARYAMAALHFFRSYTLMSYGAGETGRPPSPMWFSGYGNYVWSQVPCLYMGYDFNIDNSEFDLVSITNPEDFSDAVAQINRSSNLNTDIDAFRADQGDDDNYLPTVLTFGSVTLKVQHTPNYWKREFSLEKFKKGELLNEW